MIGRPINRLVLLAFLISLSCFQENISASPAQSNLVTYTFVDNTKLPKGDYKIYITGYSTTGGSKAGYGLVLSKDSSGNLTFVDANRVGGPVKNTSYPAYPCFPIGDNPAAGDAVSITFDSSSNYASSGSLSGRLYYFITSSSGPACTPSIPGNGLFNVKPMTSDTGWTAPFVYYSNGTAMTGVNTSDVVSGAFPPWVFSEIGSSSTAMTIDASQVDMVSFPLNITVNNTATTAPGPTSTGVGNNLSSEHVTQSSILTSFNTTFPSAPWSSLQQPVGSTFAVPGQNQYLLLNPGNYASSVQPNIAGLSTLFDNLITNYFWTDSTSGLPHTGKFKVRTGEDENGNGDLNVIFTASYMSAQAGMFYPVCNNMTGSCLNGKSGPSVGALIMKDQKGFIYYLYNPIEISNACRIGTIPQDDDACAEGGPANNQTELTGTEQIFGGLGALGTPSSNAFKLMIRNSTFFFPNQTPQPTYTQYKTIGTRINLIISGVFNRGVAGLYPNNCTLAILGDCWQDGNYWYPNSTANPDAYFDYSQNSFSYWTHTSTDGANNALWTRPNSAQKSAGGLEMSMAYGFGDDENQTPVPPNTSPQAEVPAKYDQNVPYGSVGKPNMGTITLGPWTSSSPYTPVNGLCGSANGTFYTNPPPQTPTTVLCAAGNPTPITSTAGVYYWTCSGTYGGSPSAQCKTLAPQPGSYTLGGVLSGMSANSSVIIDVNGGDPITLGKNGAFTFGKTFGAGGTYNVAVHTQPSGQTCTVSNGSGTFTSGNVNNVMVTCLNDSAKVNGVCGVANGVIYSQPPPESQECSSGNPSLITQLSDQRYGWTCSGTGGGSTAICETEGSSGKKNQSQIFLLVTPRLNVGRGEFLRIEGGSGTGAVSYKVTASGKVSCSLRKVGSRIFLKTERGAGICTVIATKAATSSYNAKSSTPIAIVVR